MTDAEFDTLLEKSFSELEFEISDDENNSDIDTESSETNQQELFQQSLNINQLLKTINYN